jgi:hypothetical protein
MEAEPRELVRERQADIRQEISDVLPAQNRLDYNRQEAVLGKL